MAQTMTKPLLTEINAMTNAQLKSTLKEMNKSRDEVDKTCDHAVKDDKTLKLEEAVNERLLHLLKPMLTECTSELCAEIQAMKMQLTEMKNTVEEIMRTPTQRTQVSIAPAQCCERALVIGDSLIRDFDDTKMTETKVVSITGGTMGDIAEELNNNEDQYKQVICCVGTNDCGEDAFSGNEFSSQAEQLLEIAKAKANDVRKREETHKSQPKTTETDRQYNPDRPDGTAKILKVEVNNSNMVVVETAVRPTMVQGTAGVLNAQSIRNKTLSIMDHVLEKEIDILAITETWLREGDAALATELTPSGYVFQHITQEAREEEDHDRIRRGGGVGILIRKDIKHELVKKESSYQSFEMIEMKIYVQNKSIRIVNIYRPHRLYNGDLSWGTFMVDFNSFLAEHLASTGNLLLVGDINIPVNKKNDPHV
ncbi:hypothetical protein CAPTEDRAFT_186385 [Capitella teleta]|uniref:Endonuclease/exonuclease/phosphatase domain-containing protein n=1 Tax=Capitella teleta TaxID=283909 RepID=R7TYZ1_CAPTE|nr:hypothetical protein CAPTEDRAFT_186385 [Capitella teleta]|eukprot:ELT98964.1 hypothetical protein CAPTEDRAFT_186385 [Capitella teleta]